MGIKNTDTTYGWLAKGFHWLLACGIISMIIMGIYMDGMDISPDKIRLYGLHKSFGITILSLAALRLFWRWRNIQPALPGTMPWWQILASKISHLLLYLLMFLMPVSGWLMSSAFGFPVSFFGLFVLPDLVGVDKDMAGLYKEIHETGMLLLIALILVHSGAALLHHFHYRDTILKRMLPW